MHTPVRERNDLSSYRTTPFRMPNSAYDDPFTTPYPARRPADVAAVAPVTWPPPARRAGGIVRWEQAYETMGSASAMRKAQLALETLQLKRHAHEVAFQDLSFAYRNTRRAKDARRHAEEVAMFEEEQVLVSRSIVRWVLSSKARALRRWMQVAKRSAHLLAVARKAIMSLRHRHVRLCVNSWVHMAEERRRCLHTARAVVCSLRHRHLRAGLNSWKELTELQLLAHQRLHLAASEWRGDSLRGCWRVWRAAMERMLLLERGASIFRPEARSRRRALNTWRLLAKTRRWRQLADATKPKGRNYRKELMDYHAKEYGKAPSGLPMIQFRA